MAELTANKVFTDNNHDVRLRFKNTTELFNGTKAQQEKLAARKHLMKLRKIYTERQNTSRHETPLDGSLVERQEDIEVDKSVMESSRYVRVGKNGKTLRKQCKLNLAPESALTSIEDKEFQAKYDAI